MAIGVRPTNQKTKIIINRNLTGMNRVCTRPDGVIFTGWIGRVSREANLYKEAWASLANLT